MDPRSARRAVGGALLAGVIADLAFDGLALGLNVPLATVGILALVTWFGASRRPADPIDWWLPGVAVLASLGPALRTDPTVILLDLALIVGGITAWSLAVAGIPVTRRVVIEVTELGLEAMLALGVGAAILLRKGHVDGFLARGAATLGRAAPVARGLLVAVPVVGAFAVLLASADAVFGRGLDELLSLPIELDDVARRSVVVVAVAWLVGGSLAIAGGAFRPPLVTATPPSDWDAAQLAREQAVASGADRPAKQRGATEALIVLAAVDVLFAAFAFVQIVYLFGGADTLAAIGMTYSDYARQGYFQLVAVVALAGLLLVGVHLVVGRTRAFLAAASALLLLTAVILASATLRLRLYQEAYGWTELRFYVAASILWLACGAAVAAGLLWTNRMRWLAHGLAASAVAITLGISALGPHAFVTHENLARVLHPELVAPGGHPGFDATYAVTLSDDAVPDLVAALAHLSQSDHDVVLYDLRRRRDELARDTGSSPWIAWNLARERARAALETLPRR